MVVATRLLLLVHHPVDGQLPSVDLEGGFPFTWRPLLQREMQLRSANLVRTLERLGLRQVQAGSRVRLDGGAAHEPEGSIGLEAPGAIGVSPLSDERWSQGRSRRRGGGGRGHVGRGRPIAGAATEHQREQRDAEKCGVRVRRHFLTTCQDLRSHS